MIVYGARQVGKTTLINETLNGISKGILKINADEREYVEILSSRDFIKLRNLVEGYDILFIDEAQRVPEIGISLKILHDRMPDLHIVVTGSSSLDLSARTREPLTGRTWTHILYPISINEWKNYTGANAYETERNLNEFLLYGMYSGTTEDHFKPEAIRQLLLLENLFRSRNRTYRGERWCPAWL